MAKIEQFDIPCPHCEESLKVGLDDFASKKEMECPHCHQRFDLDSRTPGELKALVEDIPDKLTIKIK